MTMFWSFWKICTLVVLWIIQFLYSWPITGIGKYETKLILDVGLRLSRFADIRNTIQGKQEERLPFFSFTFPDWFKQKYKKAHDNFLSNLNKLATPFDIYSTLMDVLHFQNKDVADLTSRSVSLFSKVCLSFLKKKNNRFLVFCFVDTRNKKLRRRLHWTSLVCLSWMEQRSWNWSYR